MNALLRHVKQHSVGYVALVVALSGTAYAAANLPPRSIGARELKTGAATTRVIKNGSVTARKLDPKSIPTSVRSWATIDFNGHVAEGTPGTHVLTWGNGHGIIRFSNKTVGGCFALGTANGFSPEPGLVGVSGGGQQVEVEMADSAGRPIAEGVTVAVFCPGR